MFSIHTITHSRRFQIPSVWKNVFREKLSFDDGLVWTESLNGEIKLRFQNCSCVIWSKTYCDVNIWLLRDSAKNKNIVFVVTAEYLEF